jgi:polynucleotide 5'-kinase involved in rRNA processing
MKEGLIQGEEEFNMTNINNDRYEPAQLLELVEKSKKIRAQRYKLVVLGPTKAGKSTFLRFSTNMKGCILAGVERETTHFWRFYE